jgi:hypothetical protein
MYIRRTVVSDMLTYRSDIATDECGREVNHQGASPLPLPHTHIVTSLVQPPHTFLYAYGLDIATNGQVQTLFGSDIRQNFGSNSYALGLDI